MTYRINDLLVLKPSTIPKAGWGVFATSFISKGTYLGYYQGKKIKSEKTFVKNVKSGRSDPSYAFDVHSGTSHFVLDATDPQSSNWTRYMNCSRSDQEENVLYADRDGMIKFYTTRAINPGTELMFYYGEMYAEKLGIRYRSKYYE